jgi:exosortase J
MTSRLAAKSYRLPSAAIFTLVLSAAVSLLLYSDRFTTLWWMWTTDGLRSIGILIPPLAGFFCIRSWRETGVRADGSMLGVIPLIVAPILLALIPGILFGFVLALTVAAAIIVILGRDAAIAAKFGIALLILVNPVPGPFSGFVDIPLQHIGARAAFGFAHFLHLPYRLSDVSLLLPSGFGLFVATSCNGLRSAVSMGYVALIAGAFHRWPGKRHTLLVIAALLLGYLLNFTRLFTLVLFNWVSYHYPAVDPFEPWVDRVVGGVLFLAACLWLFTFIRDRQPRPAVSVQVQAAHAVV